MSEHFRKLERMYHAAPINRIFSPTLVVTEGRATVMLQVQEGWFHSANALHGSVYFKALDDAAFFAVSSLVPDRFVVTVSFHVHLLRPVEKGVLRCEGVVTASTSRLLVADSVLSIEGDRDDRPVARGSGTFMRSRVRLEEVESYR